MNIYSCPQCNKTLHRKLKYSVLLICPQCSAKVYGDTEIPTGSNGVPEDWSIIQVGSTFKYNEKKHEIIGRVRIQMKEDFRNLWCATDNDGNPMWISQSLESMAFSEGDFKPFPPKSDIDLNAGGKIVFADKVKMRVIFSAPCSSINYEGEIARFPAPMGNFIFLHGVNDKGNTILVVCVNGSMSETEMLWGVTKQLDAVQFENTRKFDEWRA